MSQGVTALKKLEELKQEKQLNDSQFAQYVQNNSQAQFYDNKLKTIRFYIQVVLPSFEANAIVIDNKNYDALDIVL